MKLVWILVFLLLQSGLGFAQGTQFFGEDPVTTLPPATYPPRPVSTLPPRRTPQPSQQDATSNSDILFLIDLSGSMESNLPGKAETKLQAAKQALTFFNENMKPGARFQLWSFNQSIDRHSPKGIRQRGFVEVGPIGAEVRQKMSATIHEFSTKGGTRLYQAVAEALQYFHSAEYQPLAAQTRYKVIVVLADGQDDGRGSVTLAQLLALKKRYSDIEIKAIGYGVSQDGPFFKTLCQIATSNQCSIAQDEKVLIQLVRSFAKA